jgi:hypothetical protein
MTESKNYPHGKLISRSGYSAHEHTLLSSSLASTTLPQDIIIETLVSVLIVSIGLVLSAQKLKPVSWREWAGEIEREGGSRNPYMSLEERYGFWDIRVSFGIPTYCWAYHGRDTSYPGPE